MEKLPLPIVHNKSELSVENTELNTALFSVGTPYYKISQVFSSIVIFLFPPHTQAQESPSSTASVISSFSQS